MAAISIAASVLSGVMGAIGAIQQGNAAAAASEYNARLARIQAGSAAMAGSAQEARLQDQNARRLATARNAAGANGVQIDSGTPLDVMADLAGQGALDAELVRWRTQNQVNAGLSQAAMDDANAKTYRQSGLIRGATTLLTGFGSAASQGFKAGYFGGTSSALSVPGGNAP
jgi:hypothetical protein